MVLLSRQNDLPFIKFFAHFLTHSKYTMHGIYSGDLFSIVALHPLPLPDIDQFPMHNHPEDGVGVACDQAWSMKMFHLPCHND